VALCCDCVALVAAQAVDFHNWACRLHGTNKSEAASSTQPTAGHARGPVSRRHLKARRLVDWQAARWEIGLFGGSPRRRQAQTYVCCGEVTQSPQPPASSGTWRSLAFLLQSPGRVSCHQWRPCASNHQHLAGPCKRTLKCLELCALCSSGRHQSRASRGCTACSVLYVQLHQHCYGDLHWWRRAN